MKWSWQGAVALVLACTLGGGYAAVLVIIAWRGLHLDSTMVQFLAVTGSPLIGGLAGWLGGSAVAASQQNHPADE